MSDYAIREIVARLARRGGFFIEECNCGVLNINGKKRKTTGGRK